MLNEDNVLFILKQYLMRRKWEILAYKSPGGHGGMIIKINGQPNMIPDMIAYKYPYLLCIEAKPNFSFKDKNKLDLLFENDVLFQNLKDNCTSELIQKRIKFPQHIRYIKTLAYGKGTQVPDDFLVFKVLESNDVLVNVGNKIAINIKYF
jgi:hypothetical protein